MPTMGELLNVHQGARPKKASLGSWLVVPALRPRKIESTLAEAGQLRQRQTLQARYSECGARQRPPC